MIGRTIDRYDVVEKLGQGGMGVVYRARDTVLDRFVALKVLPPDKSDDPERRQRFLGEARAASALNHPGIVAVYDIKIVDGQDVIVMELVEGETLEQRLARHRLPRGEALGLAIDVADALACAHAAGIVHRDLKPSNVMVTPDGGVKILDFGLAKLVEAPFPGDESPTLSRHESLTAAQVVVGTIAWMSPEQAAGQPVDARSDIFAFGLLLYEMLTGTHPFRRGTTTETLTAIREADPEPPTRRSPDLPLEAERAVLRCLRKDPARRWQSVSDLGAVLGDVKEDSESGRQVVSGTATGRRRVPWGLIGVAAVLIAAVVIGILLLRREPAPAAPLELRRLTYDAGVSFVPAISPDGNLVAYASDRGGEGVLDIWVRHINQPEPVRLTRHPADDWLPRFSPDGSRIVFRSNHDGGGIHVINALGGNERKIAPRGLFASFSPDGSQVAYAEDPDFAPRGLLRMFRVPVEGGTPEPLVPGFGAWRPPGGTGPLWSPDGRFVLFRGAPLENPRQNDWWVAPVAGGEPRSSGAMEALPRIDFVQVPCLWLPDQLLFVAGTTIEGVNLYRARISGEGAISGPAEPLTAGPGMTWRPSASRDGRLALSRFQWVVHLWEVPLDPTNGRPAGPPRRITDDAAPKFSFSLTHDGNRLAYSAFSGSPGNRRGEVRLEDRVSGDEAVAYSMAATSTTSLFPRLSPDGSLLSMRFPVEGRWVTFVGPLGESPGRELCEGCWVVAFFSDGREVLVDRGRSLHRLDLGTGTEQTVLEVEGRALLDADLSWDDEWLVVRTGEPEGATVLSVLPLRDPPVPPDEWVEIAGREEWVGPPRWSADGHLVYYLSDRDEFTCVWARALDPATRHPVGEPFAVVHAHDSRMKMMEVQRGVWSLTVAADRLVFNAAEASGNVYTAMLPSE